MHDSIPTEQILSAEFNDPNVQVRVFGSTDYDYFLKSSDLDMNVFSSARYAICYTFEINNTYVVKPYSFFFLME